MYLNSITLLPRLPIDMATGEPVYAEASVKGRKKDAVVQCALNACRLLDAQDMLRNPIHRMLLITPCEAIPIQSQPRPTQIIFLSIIICKAQLVCTSMVWERD